VPFIDDMVSAYVDASLVIARAGASTLAELCAIGRPSVLVPLPSAAGGHQLVNARALEQAGAALAIEEAALDPVALGDAVAGLLGDPARRQAMGVCARRLGKPEAAAAIVDDLLGFLGVPSGSTTGEDPAPVGGSSSTDGEPPLDAAELHSVTPIRRRPKVKRAAVRLRAVGGAVSAVR